MIFHNYSDNVFLFLINTQTKQLQNFYKNAIEYGHSMSIKGLGDFQIKINNGVIEEIKWVSDEMYEPYLLPERTVRDYNEYYVEHGWKYVTLENKYGLHLNVHTGKKTDAGGNSWPSH